MSDCLSRSALRRRARHENYSTSWRGDDDPISADRMRRSNSYRSGDSESACEHCGIRRSEMSLLWAEHSVRAASWTPRTSRPAGRRALPLRSGQREGHDRHSCSLRESVEPEGACKVAEPGEANQGQSQLPRRLQRAGCGHLHDQRRGDGCLHRVHGLPGCHLYQHLGWLVVEQGSQSRADET